MALRFWTGSCYHATKGRMTENARMADIEQSMPTAPLKAWQHGGGGAGGNAYSRMMRRSSTGGGGDEGPDDPVSLGGLDPTSITPDVQRLIDGLMEEIDTQRWRVAQAERRQELLEGLADQDSWLPTLNRRAFLRRLGAYLERPRPEDASVGTLVVIYLDNFEDIRRSAGLLAAREALRHLARQVVGSLRASDVVGSIGGAGLAILFTTGDPDGAWVKVDQLMEAVATRPLTIGGSRLELRPIAVSRPLETGETAEAALSTIEDRLRRTV